jgi:hypothetical protein
MDQRTILHAETMASQKNVSWLTVQAEVWLKSGRPAVHHQQAGRACTLCQAQEVEHQ